jgi:hypothetical protein
MRICVIGLLPAQAQEVKSSFPDHDLTFLPRERERETSDFAKRSDKVAIMRKFIPHSVQDQIPMRKRAIISGGVTSLKTWLSQQPTPVKLEARSVKTIKFIEPASNQDQNDMANGKKKSMYGIDYATALKKAKEGDVLVFNRPRTQSRDKWVAGFSVMKSYYKMKVGILFEVELKGDEARLLVTKIDKDFKANKAAKAGTTQAVATAETTTEHNAPDVPRRKLDDLTSEFWQRLFLMRQQGNPGAAVAELSNFADAAVAAFRARYD